METISVLNDSASATDTETRQGPILVATDGMQQSLGALAVARSLAGTVGSAVQVIAVQRSIALVVPDASLLREPSAVTRLLVELTDRVRLQCTEISGSGSGPVLADPEILSGEPERVITRLAKERGAQLIIVGIGRHDIMDRIFGTETALRVARTSRVPVLAVPADVRAAPRRAVVGVDFSDPSLHAAQGVLQLLAGGGVVHLVHVAPKERLLLDPYISDREYADLVRHRLTRFRARLTLPPNVTVEEHSCSGDVARELIGYAEREHADVIAAGSHGHGFVSRLVLGSVTTALLRGARTAVFVVPLDAMPLSATTIDDGGETARIEPSQWPAVLADFTRANAGRRTRLELDDPDIGAQAEEIDYPLRGVSFDAHDRRLEIMLGRDGSGEPHLSRSIADVSALDLLTDKDGNDVALRATHGAGQTLLTFDSA